jgi:biotin synthase-like enzyme
MGKKKKFLDSNINFKKKTVEKIQLYNFNDKLLPLPTEIEISESGICNRKCSFCPRSDPNYKDIKEFISDNLILKISKLDNENCLVESLIDLVKFTFKN